MYSWNTYFLFFYICLYICMCIRAPTSRSPQSPKEGIRSLGTRATWGSQEWTLVFLRAVSSLSNGPRIAFTVGMITELHLTYPSRMSFSACTHTWLESYPPAYSYVFYMSSVWVSDSIEHRLLPKATYQLIVTETGDTQQMGLCHFTWCGEQLSSQNTYCDGRLTCLESIECLLLMLALWQAAHVKTLTGLQNILCK